MRIQSLNVPQKEKALEWLSVVDREVEILEEGFSNKPVKWVLTLKEDQSIAWSENVHWERLVKIAGVLPSERDI